MTSTSQEYTISSEKLNEKWEGLYDGFDDNPVTNKQFEENHQLLLRLQRAISWLDGAQRVERCAGGEVVSAQFIFFWIGFNALYARNFHESADSKPEEIQHIKLIKEYFDNILDSKDAKNHIRDVIDSNISTEEINKLTKGRLGLFVQSNFFKKYYKMKKRGNWIKEQLTKLRLRPKARKQDTRELLDILFECLCVLRNQLMHGGSTWDSKLNKEQLSIGIKIIQCLLPVFIEMEESDNNNPPSDKKELEGNLSFLLCADSWLSVTQKMEKGLEEIGKDINTQFIFLWIGFNAVYARDEGNLSQKKQIETYFQKLLKCNEAKNNIYKVIDNSILKEKIESLENGITLSKDFLKKEEAIPLPRWNKESTKTILYYIFQRLRALRDELVHGHVAWDCQLKKSQLTDGTKIMHQLLPVFIDIMLKIPEKEWKQWGKIWQPRVLGVGIKGKPFEQEKHFNSEKMKEIFGLK